MFPIPHGVACARLLAKRATRSYRTAVPWLALAPPESSRPTTSPKGAKASRVKGYGYTYPRF